MKVSIVLPVYNNEKTLRECLNGIRSQTYKDYEIMAIDGGSTDNTLKIAKEFKCKILKNPFRIEERARVQGIKESKGEILCFIDADNFILDKDWIKKMLEPFKDKEIVGSDTISYTFRKEDGLVTKYCSLIGGDDPIAIYLGLYDRYNYFKNDWTDFPYTVLEKNETYTKVQLDPKKIPAMGSNGFLYRKKDLIKINYEPFIHTDIIYKLVNSGHDKFAKVNTSLVHYLFGVRDFFKKKTRRLKRRNNNEVKIEYSDYGLSKFKIFLKLLRILLILPVFYDTFKGFIKKPTLAWIFHPIATYGTLVLYIYYNLIRIIK
ncbi:MAG: glycosyltransferase family 2 protein [Candidatus Nanoarchaeia archaeon]|nr:glycosyltransferase family 2 protein [Candidatus Nanoarchaeia archaeon]MDD5587626.1 glycosyltransferase family 2 protein [Candidatus Nanoarchaeia archaeon]